MEFFEKNISNLIENQFPDVYRENGPDFVDFVESYYEWMETANNTLYHSRRLMEYRDVDSTINSFLIHFKNKYLNNIKFDTAVSTPNLVKHAVDIYRSKGTERSLSLFFKSIFGVDAEVYFPSQDIFKTSAGIWIEPEYLELSLSDNIKNFENIQIEGVDSGATAFVQSFIQKRSAVNPIYTYMYFITNRVGDFITGEHIRASTTHEIGPSIIGSLTTLQILDGGANFQIGDIVYIKSNSNGIDAKGRVANTQAISGKVSFSLVDGGWGYNSNSKIIISDNVLTLSNVVAGNLTSTDSFYHQFETIIQPIANLSYDTRSNGHFTIGDTVYRTDVSNVTYAVGKVLFVNETSNTTGNVLISTGPVDIIDNKAVLTDQAVEIIEFQTGINMALENITVTSNNYLFDSTSGAIANIISITDQSAYANVMKISSNVTIVVSNSTTQFSNGDYVYQLSPTGVEIANGVINIVSYSGTTATIRITNATGSFYANTLNSRLTSANGYVNNITMSLGVFNTNNSFISTNNNIVYGSYSNTVATISRISMGSLANFSIVNNFVNIETVYINTDIIGQYSSVLLNSTDYGMPAVGVETLSTTLATAFTYSVTNYGRIKNIIVTNNGLNYDTSPYVIIYESSIAKFNKKDFILNVSNTTGNFSVGEVVTQNGVPRGLIKAASNTTTLYLNRITFGDITTTSNVVGVLSGASAVVTSVYEDVNTLPVGINAQIIANTAIAGGAVTSLDIINSGKSYYNGEIVNFSVVDPNLTDRTTGQAIVNLGKQGKAEGYYKENDSVTSGNKYLQDGDYYQNFSYEIQSSITLDKYADILKNIFHIAGTKHFSKYILEDKIDTSTHIDTTTITYT